MITEKDIKMLRSSQSRNGKVSFWVLVTVTFVFLAAAILNLHIASKIGSFRGYSLIQLIQCWIIGVDSNAQYSGIYVAATQRLLLSFLQIILALMFSILTYGHCIRRKMDERILEALNKDLHISEHNQRLKSIP